MCIYAPEPMPMTGTNEEAILAEHRKDRLWELERLKETAPEHHKAEIDRIWNLVRDSS